MPKRKANWQAIRLALGKASQMPARETDLMDQSDADFAALLAGTVDAAGFTRICEMVTALHVAGELLRQRGVEETRLSGWMYRQTADAAGESLTHIAKRFEHTGRFGGTAAQYGDVREALAAMRKLIPVLTRGELITVLHKAADMVEGK